ncbi:TIGR04219 family outer membrane beta-barrel protein [Rheinheimera maricola]|uniref:TIGR04219 family outer membrane beta-barrel protein n=1 Tax=Rheinheimera maricola TaxID=2793282 RepID=A0ABS7X6J4_9GAMM|nr:TIGR04219 family outer membrane beta-barrel protein [Rheinheimera maricola]MBZ9611164.1 TIGR04219 family outer membrane beta-barrel protein [Rheinheimera maricola]
MKYTAVVFGLSCLLFTVNTQADTLLGVYAGVDGWQASTDGSFSDTSQLQQFSFKDKTQAAYFVALEHPIPLLPNIKIQHNKLQSAGATVLETSFSFAGEDFNAGTTLGNQLDLSNTDYVLYYEMFDNDLVSFDLGVNAKYIKGNISVSDAANNLLQASQDASTLIPMLYSAAAVGLPLTGLDVFAQGSYVSYQGSQIYDVQAGVAYALLDNLAINMRLKLGYRVVNLRLDDIDNLYTNVDFKGLFAGVELHF